jgi:hypothetical protein
MCLVSETCSVQDHGARLEWSFQTFTWGPLEPLLTWVLSSVFAFHVSGPVTCPCTQIKHRGEGQIKEG